MVQVLKEHIKERILCAAEKLFAKDGVGKTTMGGVAREAGVATGNLYKYFPGKEALFAAIVTDNFVDEFKQLTRNRVAAFARPNGLTPHLPLLQGEAGELLRFWIRNRLKVVIVLSRSEGTKYESFALEYRKGMLDQTIAQAREQYPDLEITGLFRFMVDKILADSIRGIVSILENYDTEESISQAFAACTTYQFAGINAFIAWARGKGSV